MLCLECNFDHPISLTCDCGVSLCPACMDGHKCSTERPLWASQVKGIELSEQAVREGHRAIVLTSPTGGGKTRIATELARRAVAKGKRAAIFTNRKILRQQAADTLDAHGVNYGLMAAGYSQAIRHGVQVASIQTIASRVFNSEQWELPAADLVIIDEAHSNKANVATRIIEHYKQQRAVVIGMTATPVGLAGLYTKLVQAGTNSELRACGALVPCDVFAPDEPDMKGVKTRADGEYVQEQAAKRVMETIVFGNVFAHWKRLNPFMLPTLLFAPGVDESRWFASEFEAQGIRAAHIDGETEDSDRRSIIGAHKAGDIKVISSCGVLREGADLPWTQHGILIQPCGMLSTFLQIVGRLLRAWLGKLKATLQDHAGAFHRHGSPNADRLWKLDDTDKSIAKALKKRREQGIEDQPICCPRCNGIRGKGPKCPHCGHEHVKSVRMVRMTDGTLEKVTGDTVKRKKQVSADQRTWTSCLYAAAARGQTLRQAARMFNQKTGHYPNGLENLPPHSSLDWAREVTAVFPWIGKRRQKA